MTTPLLIAQVRAPSPLARLAELERRYNGPIPAPLLDVVRHGSPERAALLRAEAQAREFRGLALDQLNIIRKRRAVGTAHAGIDADLRLYLARWRHWRRVARELRAGREHTAVAELERRAAIAKATRAAP